MFQSKPRANNPTFLPNEYIERARLMLDKFGETALSNFGMFWDIQYDECIDFTSLGYEGGLFWFLRDNNHVFNLRFDDGSWFVSNSNPKSRLEGFILAKGNDQQAIEPISYDIGLRVFNPASFLWTGQPWSKLLSRSQFTIHRSAYEYALDHNFMETSKIIRKIHETLARFPSGLNLKRLYRHIDVNAALKIFNVSTSANSLVDELPEVFYRKEIDGETRVFDGYLHGPHDLKGTDSSFLSEHKPEEIATQAITDGIYQKTLLLIKQADLDRGLKINVWRKSMKTNFYPLDEDEFDSLVKTPTLIYFQALARYDLIELRCRDNRKNDLVAFLPTKPVDYMELKKQLNGLVPEEMGSEAD